MSFDNYPQPRSRIGFAQSILIHLAGADPAAFAKLPPFEATEYTKIGLTVLIPFILALTAGTFTIYSILDSKNPTLAFFGGLVWALIVLAIDVVVMGQLIKPAPLPAPAPKKQGRRPVYAPREEDVAVQPPPKTPSAGKIALVRISISFILGLVISHSLILAVFKNGIAQRVTEIRKEKLAKLGEQHEQIDAKRRQKDEIAHLLQLDDAPLVSEYKKYLAPRDSSGSQSSPLETTSPTTTLRSTADTSALEASLDALDEQMKKEKMDSMPASYADDKKRLSDLKADLPTAEDMLKKEASGAKLGGWNFHAEDFKQTMGQTTSGLRFQGQRYRQMERFVDNRRTELSELEARLKKIDEADAALATKYDKRRKELQQRIDELREQANQIAADNEKKNINNLVQDAAADRAALRARQDELDKDISGGKQLLDQDTAPLVTGSQDVMESTKALVDLLLGRDSHSTFLGTGVMLVVFLLILLSVLLIDLTPLTLKLMKPAGPYDAYVAWIRSQPFRVDEDQSQQAFQPEYNNKAGTAPPPENMTSKNLQGRRQPPPNGPSFGQSNLGR